MKDRENFSQKYFLWQEIKKETFNQMSNQMDTFKNEIF